MAMVRLRDHPGVAADHASRARSLENRVEKVYRHAVAAIFANAQDVPRVVEGLKYREVYRHLSNAADRCVEAADVIERVVVKFS